ncbi:hypothetical protein [Aquimarina sp. SS2-1]|uniref:hypothetical protein n=1 Tax=Aquimarina besae TaxID=3342247 RepID=UPI00366BF4DF
MKNLLDYILKFGCLFTLSIFLALKVGPYFICLKSIEKSKIKEYEGVEELRLTLINPIDVNYIKLNVLLSDNNTYTKIYRLKDNKHKELFEFLEEQNISISNLTIDTFPIEVPKKKLNQIDKVQMHADGSNVINKLILNNYYLVGQKGSIFKNVSFIILGVFFILLGLLLFFSSINLLVTNIKIYRRTGEIPKLWNTIDSKIEAWKYILGKNKTKKDL